MRLKGHSQILKQHCQCYNVGIAQLNDEALKEVINTKAEQWLLTGEERTKIGMNGGGNSGVAEEIVQFLNWEVIKDAHRIITNIEL